MDYDTPHKLGERSEEGKEVNGWLKSGGTFSSCRNSEIVGALPAGVYTVFQDGRGATHAQAFNIKTDDLYLLPNNQTSKLIREIDDFWKKGDKFKAAGVKHKRGILLMGHPGTGKTSLINLFIIDLIESGGLVFYIHNQQELFWYMEFVQSHLRVIEPDRPVITVMEDIDKYMDSGGVESTILNFLDGAESFDHHVVVATTNRLEGLNDLLVRPSRFDWQIQIDKPDELCRKTFLVNKGLEEPEAKKWAKETDDYSIAELKELFISVKLLDLSYEDAKAKLKDQSKIVTTKTYTKPRKDGMGFKMNGS